MSTLARFELRARTTFVEVVGRLEDAIYGVVAILLVVAAGFLVVSAVTSAYDELTHSRDALLIVLTVLDKGLVLFIVAELLHTVRVTVGQRTLAPEPFLIVGLIAGVRRVLILTAHTEQNFQWSTNGIELLILVALIFVMAVAILVWRRSMVTGPGS